MFQFSCNFDRPFVFLYILVAENVNVHSIPVWQCHYGVYDDPTLPFLGPQSTRTYRMIGHSLRARRSIPEERMPPCRAQWGHDLYE
jgi:hypothetical protein